MIYGPYEEIIYISVMVNDGETEIRVKATEPTIVSVTDLDVEVFQHKSGLNVWENRPNSKSVVATNGGVAIGGNFTGGFISTGNNDRFAGASVPAPTPKSLLIIQAPGKTRLTIDRRGETEFEGTVEEYQRAKSKSS
jgi:hypothetical protein